MEDCQPCSQDLYDVCIIGGGPGGLAAAFALQQASPGIRVQVFDSTKDFKLCGAGLGISANGLKALQAISSAACQELEDTSRKPADNQPTLMYDDEGNGRELPGAGLSNKDGQPQRFVATGWFELHQLLRKHLQPNTIQLGKRFTSLADKGSHVEVTFEDGSHAKGKLVLGADGYFSKVREHCLGDGPPDFAETVYWRARVPWQEGLPAKDRNITCFGKKLIAIIFPIVNGHIVWTVAAPFKTVVAAGVTFAARGLSEGHQKQLDALRDEDEWSTGQNKKDSCLQVLGEYGDKWPDVLKLIKATSPDAVLEHGTYTRPAEAIPDKGWGRGRVTLLGDAAHPMRPTGQGVCTALEDAAELAAALQEQGLCEKALRTYELGRAARMQTMTRVEMITGLSAYKEGVEDLLADVVKKSPFKSGNDPEYRAFVNNREFRRLAEEAPAPGFITRAPMSDQYDVCVIGGGPGGLAAALGLLEASPGIKVGVFDQAPEFRLCGAGLALSPNGLSALKAISPAAYQELEDTSRKTGANRPGLQIDDEGNAKEMKTPAPSSGDQPRPSAQLVLTTGWFELQQLLYRHVQPSNVQLGKRFKSLQETGDGVEISFEDGSTVRSKLVLGADGYHSRVREHCLGDGPPDFAETVFWRARVPAQDWMAAKDRSYMYSGQVGLGLLFPIVNDNIVWTLGSPLKTVSDAGVKFVPRNVPQEKLDKLQQQFQDDADNEWSTGKSKKDRCLQVLSHAGHDEKWADLRKIIEATDPDAVLEHGTYTRPAEAIPDDGWGRGPVTLLGDAAHPLRPTGQGANTALEDAADLAASVQLHGVTEEAFRAYEQMRGPRMKIITQVEMAQGLSAYKEGIDEAKAAAINKSPYKGNSDPRYREFVASRKFKPLKGREAVPVGTSAMLGARQRQHLQQNSVRRSHAGLTLRPRIQFC